MNFSVWALGIFTTAGIIENNNNNNNNEFAATFSIHFLLQH